MKRKCPIVGIGASAGGLEALKSFFDNAPADMGAAVVVIQHLDPSHPSLTAEILARHTKMPTRQIVHGEAVEIDHVYVIPPNANLALNGNVFELTQPAPQHELRLPIDAFFRSLAAQRDRGAVGVILSGTGADGSAGIRDIKGAGGIVFAQTPETAQFDGMPRAATATGCVDVVCSVEEMPQRIKDYLSHKHVKQIAQTDEAQVAPDDDAHLKSIIALLNARLGHDLKGYKKGTLERRITRRMSLSNIDEMSAYLAYLKDNQKEIEDLYQDLLINVTSFFRDPDAFDALAASVLTKLVEDKGEGDQIRVWVPACSTGEEAYSIAMLLIEKLEVAHKDNPIQVFATDLDDQALAVGRAGIYTPNLVAGISAQRLERFFNKKDGNYQVSKQLREKVTFASQNIIKDPPFSRLDLISCRNLLIYLEGKLQDKIIGYLHFALVDGGYLFLGRSESTNGASGLFEPVDKKFRIFRRLASPKAGTVSFPTEGTRTHPVAIGLQPTTKATEKALLRELMQQQLLRSYAPAAVLTNAKHEVLYFTGPTAQFLEQPAGLPTQDLLALAPAELRKHLRAGLKKAVDSDEMVIIDNASLHRGRHDKVRIVIKPLATRDEADPLFMVTFEDIAASRNEPVATGAEASSQQSAVGDLEAKLREAQEDLQISLEDLETTNEELQASNEEMMSVNEELQSTNEELETSKEELQAMNEELSTVNNQLKDKVEQLADVNDDLKNFVASTGIATILLDSKFNIGRFTPATNRLFNLIDTDLGRPISDIRQKFADDKFLSDVEKVFKDLNPVEREIIGDDGACYIMRITPYRAMEQRPGGVVINFVDISQRLQGERKLRESEARFRSLVENAPDPLLLVNADGDIALANSQAQKFFGYDQHELIGMKMENLMPLRFREHHQAYRKSYMDDVKVRAMGPGLEVFAVLKSGEEIPIEVTLGPVKADEGVMVCASIKDIREHQRAVIAVQEARDKAERAAGAKARFLATASHDLRQPLQSLAMLTEALALKVDDPNMVALVEQQTASLANMSGLLNSLLDISKLDTGGVKVEIKEVDLCAVVAEVCASLKTEADKKGLELALDVHDRVVRSDQNLLRQILQNLIGNAVRYTAKGGVKVVSSLAGDEIKLEIKDTGVGIPADQIPHIFDEFYQIGRDPQQSNAGLGLGLAIVQRIAEKLGIRIEVESEVGKGSVFSFKLPLSELSRIEKGLPNSKAPVSPIPGGVVLLVDDDEAVLKSTMLRLSLHPDLEVFSAGSHTEAIAVLAKMAPKVPDVIITDYHLDDVKNGVDVIDDVRKKTERDIPAILLSGDTALDAAKFENRGIHLVLKPSTRNELINKLAQLISL